MVKLRIRGLRAGAEGREIIKGLDLEVRQGEIHAIMGPNGSGKSTLANVIMGHPRYRVTRGTLTFGGTDLLKLEPDKRARLGLFLAMQYPTEVEGVTFSDFLRTALNSRTDKPISAREFREMARGPLKELKMDPSFLDRHLNEGMSGGEKKRAEIFQMLLLKPRMAVLDETDSGLDIDSLKIVSSAIRKMRSPGFGAIVITHYHRILRQMMPDRVHVMVDGKIVRSGGSELAEELEEKGYEWLKGRYG